MALDNEAEDKPEAELTMVETSSTLPGSTEHSLGCELEEA